MDAHGDEIAELQAARRRLVQASDDELRRIERELHGGVQQHLVALSVELQLVRSVLGSDPEAARERLAEMARDLERAVDDASGLAHRIYAPAQEAGGLGAALRAAAMDAGTKATVDVATDTAYPPEVARTVYLCWLDALGRADDSTCPAISVREESGALFFEVVGARGSDAELTRLRDRVEALGGGLRVAPEPDGTERVTGSLPLAGP